MFWDGELRRPWRFLLPEVANHYLKKYCSGSPGFRVSEEGFKEKTQPFYETLLSLGNGYIGSRAVYEENPSGSSPGTYIAGIFDRSAAQVEELVNLPNPLSLMIAAEGEKFDIVTMQVLSNRRVLDMKNGVLVRKTLFRDARRRKYLYQSARFFSMDNPHIGAIKVSLKLIKGAARLTMVDGIDDSVFNSGGLMLAKRRHFDTASAEKKGYMNYTAFSTHSNRHLIAYADYMRVSLGGRNRRLRDRIHNFELKTGHEITFTKLFSVCTGGLDNADSLKKKALSTLRSAVNRGFDELFRRHRDSLAERWDKSDVAVKGDRACQLAIRFNIYHLLISARQEYAHFSVGAKTLSGPGYRGHIFWDTEIYILPFFIRTDPEVARAMLLFRHDTLPAARELAKENGYRGAMYPWEASADGTEQTPRYAKELDGSIGEVRTMDFEHHITADVAYGVYDYVRVTGDTGFLMKYGAEIVLETARFWADRVEYDSKGGRYHIRGVIGPDEFHVNVDDNAYTNCLAAWNLSYAAEIYRKYSSRADFGKLSDSLGLSAAEVEEWEKISEGIAIPESRKYGIIAQFDGYMRLRDVELAGYDRYFMPLAPKRYEHSGELQKTRFIKQADVLLVFHLLPELFSRETLEKNYEYYLPRTLHKSSLSYCLHSVVASELGDSFRAFAFFWAGANIDLLDIAGNTCDGIHAANLGGVWQAAVTGFGGLRIGEEGVSIRPRLPGNFREVRYGFVYRGRRFKVSQTNRKVRIGFMPGKGRDRKIPVEVFGRRLVLEPGRFRTVLNPEHKGGSRMLVKDIIKKENSLTVTGNTPAGDVGEMLINRKISSVPVVDSGKKLLGIISEKNIIKSAVDENFRRLKASDIMEKKVVCLNWNDSLETATKLFTRHPYRRLPVIKQGRVAGVLTRRDIIADFLGGYY